MCNGFRATLEPLEADSWTKDHLPDNKTQYYSTVKNCLRRITGFPYVALKNMKYLKELCGFFNLTTAQHFLLSFNHPILIHFV